MGNCPFYIFIKTLFPFMPDFVIFILSILFFVGVFFYICLNYKPLIKLLITLIYLTFIILHFPVLSKIFILFISISYLFYLLQALKSFIGSLLFTIFLDALL